MSAIVNRLWSEHGRFLILLLCISGLTRSLAGMITGISWSLEWLPLLAWSCLIPIAAYFVATGILVGRTLSPRILAMVVAIHPGIILSAEVSSVDLGLTTASLLFIALALQTFNFSFCTIPRHIIETTLMYAPEIGFMSTNYDLLVDEIGYNEIYGRHRIVWLTIMGLLWGALMTVSLGFAGFGIALIVMYCFLSSSSWRALVKTLTITLPAVALVAIQHLGVSRRSMPEYHMPALTFLTNSYFALVSPTWMLSELPKIMSYIFIGFDVVLYIGFVGTLWRIISRHFAFCHAAKVLPFLIAGYLGVVCHNDITAVWMLQPLIILLGSLFWYEQMQIESVLATYAD